MEKLIKQKLIERGFKEETLLNNRGLIGACIEEAEKQLRLYGVSGSALPNDNKEHYDCLIECCNNLLDAVESGKKPLKQIMGLKILLHR